MPYPDVTMATSFLRYIILFNFFSFVIYLTKLFQCQTIYHRNYFRFICNAVETMASYKTPSFIHGPLCTHKSSPSTRHEGAWGERMYSSYSFTTSALDGVSGQHHASATLYPRGKGPRYPLDRRLGGPQSRSGQRG
jgi:hypothetical protein